MSGLLFLTTQDFTVAEGAKGNILCHGIEGFSLILFYTSSKRCEFCSEILPIFKKLPGSVNGCQFGIVNLNRNKHLARMSLQTITPIDCVPYIIFYVNGRPYMRYNGPYDQMEVTKFIVAVGNSIKNKQAKMQNVLPAGKDRSIPQYTIGHPLYGNNKVCYVNFDDAYGKQGQGQAQGQSQAQAPQTRPGPGPGAYPNQGRMQQGQYPGGMQGGQGMPGQYQGMQQRMPGMPRQQYGY